MDECLGLLNFLPSDNALKYTPLLLYLNILIQLFLYDSFLSVKLHYQRILNILRYIQIALNSCVKNCDESEILHYEQFSLPWFCRC